MWSGMRFAAAVCAVVAAGVAWSHEFWIEPARFEVAVGDRLPVAFSLGERFAGERVRLESGRVQRLDSRIGPVTEPLVLPGDGRFALARPAAAGWMVIALQTEPVRHEMSATDFEAYLEEEGLRSISVDRQASGQGAADASERYARCAKALVRVGSATDEGWSRPAGLSLELVPRTSPDALPEGGAFELQLLDGGAPLAGGEVVAVERSAPERLLRAPTDRAGVARFVLPGGGDWLFTAIRMRRAEVADAVDWHSDWASLTLRIAAPR